jgi:hypothetical protein
MDATVMRRRKSNKRIDPTRRVEGGVRKLSANGEQYDRRKRAAEHQFGNEGDFVYLNGLDDIDYGRRHDIRLSDERDESDRC